MDDSENNRQGSVASGSPSGQTPLTTMPGHPRQHLFSSFSPSYNFLDGSYMDTSDGNASDLSHVTSMDSEGEVITGVRDMAIEPKSSRFTWLEPQDPSEHAGSPLAPQLPLGNLVKPDAFRGQDSPSLEPQQSRSKYTENLETPPRFDLLHTGTNYSSVFGFGQASPSETPPRSWPRESGENLVDSRRWPSSKSSPRLARSLFTPPFTPRSYNKSNLNGDTPSPRSTSTIQDLLLDSIATSIQEDVEFPLNDLQESLKSVTISEEHTSRQQHSQKPTRIVVLEGIDEDLAFDELRAALMAHGEIRHLSVDYSTTCLCVYYNVGAAVDAYKHIRKHGLAHQHQVNISFGDQAGLRKFGPVPDDILVNQGALIVWNHTGINLADVMVKFGDIKSLEEHELCPAEASVVEFNDVRCAKRALEYIQQHHGDSLFVEFKNPMRKTWNPPTRNVPLPSSANIKPSYFSPTLLDWDLDRHFSLSSSHVGMDRHATLPADCGDHGYHPGMMLESPERHNDYSNLETPRRLSRPKVPSIVTTFGLDDSPVSQRQQHLQQLQHESGRGIDSPLYVGPSPINHGGITNIQQVASPPSYINTRSSHSAATFAHSDLMLHSESLPIDMYGRKRMNNNISSYFGPSNNINGSRTRLFSSSLGEYASSPLSSSPHGMMGINDSLWAYSNNHNQPYMSSKLQQLHQGSLSTPLSAPATSSPVWRHSSHDSLISPLTSSPLHGGNLGSSPLVTVGTMSGANSFKAGDFELARVVAGLDNRTTFMIKNLPNKYTQQMLIDFLNETHRGEYDFLYVRIDFINRCNVGYAFINFANPGSVISFAERVVGKRWPRFNSTKVCTLSYAKIQGLDALIRKFRDSSVMLEEPAFRPKVFYTSGPSKGEEAPFPSPTISLRPSSRGLYSKTHGYIHGTDGMGSMDSPITLTYTGILSKPSHVRHSSTTSISTELTIQSNNSNHDLNSSDMVDEVEDVLDVELAGSAVANTASDSLVTFGKVN